MLRKLLSILNDITIFCFDEDNESECIIFGENFEVITERQPFTFINININKINNTSVQYFLNKYIEIYSYAYDCRKKLKNSEVVLCIKIKYNITNFRNLYFFN